MNIITAIDNSILNIVENRIQCDFLDKTMPLISNLGGVIIWLIIAAVFISIKKYRKYGIVLLISLVVCIVLASLCIKPIVKRLRPCDVYETLNLIITKPSGYSFPSGHSIRSFGAATILFKVNKKMGIPAFILAFLTAFSRVYLYAHYFTDVFVGTVLGIICSVFLYNLLIENEKVNKFLSHKYPSLWS